MRKETASQDEPVIVKKYANRRLYNTDTSTYVTLDDLAEMVRSERDFVVFDAKTGEDLTHAVLTQIIMEQESKGENLLPVRFLRQLIRFYGDNIGRLVPGYLEISLDTLTREQEKYRKQFADTFGTTAFEAMQQQARQNLLMFEKALTMFSPFNQQNMTTDEPAKTQQKKGEADKVEKISDNEIAELKAQLADVQKKLDKLS